MELGQVCPFSLFSFNIVLEVLLVNTIKQVKEIQGIQIRREEIKLSLFTEEMPVYMKNLTDFINMRTHTHPHLLELISDISTITGYKANTHKIINCIPIFRN